jgi:hypothetical protein
VTTDALYQAYFSWASGSGERAESKRYLSDELVRRGFKQAPSHKQRTWLDLGLQPIVWRATET